MSEIDPIGDFSDATAPTDNGGPIGDFSDATVANDKPWKGPARVKVADAIAAAKAAGVDPDLFTRLVFNGESGGNARAVSPKGALGPTQLMPPTAHALGVDPYDTMDNLKGGALQLKSLLDQFKGDKTKAVAAYNAGADAVNAANGVPNYPETQAYVQRVLGGNAPVDDGAAALISDADAEKAFDALHPGFNQAAPGASPITHIEWDAKTGTYRDAAGNAYGYPQGQTVAGPGGANFQIVPNAPHAPGQIPVQGLDSGTGTSGEPSLTNMTADEDRRAGAAGVSQGFQSLRSTITNADQFLEQHVPGIRAFNRFIQPSSAMNVDQEVAVEHANRIMNDAKFGSNPFYGAGKTGAMIAGTVPAMMAGGAGLGALADGAVSAVPALAPVADFLGGSAGGNLMMRGGSLAANGALQGAGAAAIGSGGSDEPFGDHVRSGAIGGAIAGPVLPAVFGAGKLLGSTVAKAVQPLTATGRGQIADSVIRDFAGDGPTNLDMTQFVPGSRPTLSQATANPGLAGAERVLRDVRPNDFVAQDQANSVARLHALSNIAGTPETIEELEAARDGKALPILHGALRNSGQADASDAVRAIDDILKSPSGQRDAVKSNLMAIREKLTTQPYSEGGAQSVISSASPLPTPGPAELSKAMDDVRASRGVQTGGLFRAIQELGGIKVRNPDGSSVAGPDVMGALNGAKVPGLINNKAGMSPEYMAQALHDRGWFEPGSDPSEAFAKTLAEHARGVSQFKPGAYAPDLAAQGHALDQEMQEAGALASDSHKVAADKLANYRMADAQEAAAIEGEAPDSASAEFDRPSAPKPSLLADRTRDASQLYGIRQSITDALSPIAARSGSNAQLAAREMMTVKSALDDSIEKAAPGYKDYLETYARMSRPVNAQQYLQGLNLTDAQGNLTLAKVKTALDGIQKRQNLPGTNGAKSVSPEQIGILKGLYADLQRASNLGLGSPAKSNTFQNLATNNLFAKAGAPLAAAGALAAHHPLLAPLAFLGRMAYSAQNGPILDEVANRFLDPMLGQAALNPVARSGFMQSGPVQRFVKGVNDNIIPAGIISGNNFFGQNGSASH